MNPYDFVRVDWERPPERHPAPTHDHFEGLSGRLEVNLTTLKPLFVPADQKTDADARRATGSDAKHFSQSPAYRLPHYTADGYFIAGSSLKGLIRNIFETVSQGCFVLFDGKYRSKPDGTVINTDYTQNLPKPFTACVDPSQLCPACRVFGFLNGGKVHTGNISFSDAVCNHAVPHDPIYTIVLDQPKPRHDQFYLRSGVISGRKYYFHHHPNHPLLTERELKVSSRGMVLNQYIQPLGANSKFTFSADFSNVAEGDFAALLYALTLEPDMRHKFGYAKPCGLGSIQIELTKLILRNPAARYRGGSSEEHYQGSELHGYLEQQVVPFARTIPAVTREDLKRTWRWEPPEDITYRYPNQSWFDDNRYAPIAETP